MTTKSFKGVNVFMSRNLVPAEIFDKLHDALKHNGAEVFPCCDPSRSGPNDYHVIFSPEHEKFEDLRAKGCNLLGPQCVLSCAKERRALPKQGFTCCLAMDGVKILASGFEMDEKGKIRKMVAAMGGVLQTKASSDVSFVIVKDVLAAKYKWALNILKKPIVTVDWLNQCWIEHRVVPQESYRVLPFSGLTICVTRIPQDERKEVERLIIQNGGKYSAPLTKECTHLVSDAPEGDKYRVARLWGNIHLVTRKWFDQCIARRACLNEESYPVQGGSGSAINTVRASLKLQHSQDKGIGNSQSAPSSLAGDSDLFGVPCSGTADPDLEATLSQKFTSSFPDAPNFIKKEDSGVPSTDHKNEINLDGCVADDSQSEDSDLYLSDCRILLVGFGASEMRKLVNMVRKGGGSRYMSFNEKLTHIVVGNPTEIEKKDLRGPAASGVMKVVRAFWLEECDREKKEVPVLVRHFANEVLFPQDIVSSNKGAGVGMNSIKQGKGSTVLSSKPADKIHGTESSGCRMPLEKSREGNLEFSINGGSSVDATAKSAQPSLFSVASVEYESRRKTQGSVSRMSLEKSREQNLEFHTNGDSSVDATMKSVSVEHEGRRKKQESNTQNVHDRKPSTVFKGRLFQFSNSYPRDSRDEVVEWVYQGGGEVVDDQVKQNVHFTVECHGLIPRSAVVSGTTIVSSHWVKSCLEVGQLVDVSSHILYSPLPCRVPLPGFEEFRFCVSQYEEKDRCLLHNLCYHLGAKFSMKLTRKVTHLLCKFTSGPKYEAAFKWNIQSVTAEWIYECVRQNKVVDLGPFFPKEVTAQDREAGLCTMTQYPTQSQRAISKQNSSQLTYQSQDQRNIPGQDTISESDTFQSKDPSLYSKRARLSEDKGHKGLPTLHSSSFDKKDPISTPRNGVSEVTEDVSHVDDLSVLEHLLEETSKIHNQKSPDRIGCERSLFSSECLILGQDKANAHSTFGLSKHWSNRSEKKDEASKPSPEMKSNIYLGFSETQESQVVSYEEDLSGRQMIIDRARIRSNLS